ncbi:glycosyltransferase family 1 protein [Aspergillus homomorphus CBS 101889]|uniref:UDP-glucoronosyl and UDP-glucosyl transferase n=1 Tax=Aspergillus homomorphus (strain CBS 101889) TaxID=1450537 RepID=A0A395IHH3_ASPHC|nr:UDP-glucoronosyl and UDP-glucosyl transferase [Aspergillus homomorphus CBS 101889]RAL17664.1 UDP-glucoronosyl and UDP-glucosyl transferase [Aspergillus homomorphus CBS 101889]
MPPGNILFLTNSELSQGNITLGVAYEFLVHTPQLRVHIASFASLAIYVDHLNHDTGARTPITGREVIFHTLPAFCKRDAQDREGLLPRNAFDAPALGFVSALRAYHRVTAPASLPWTAAEYVSMYSRITKLVLELKPVVVVVDPTLAPGVDVCRKLGWSYVMLGSGTVKDYLGAAGIKELSRFPVVGSGYDYPLSRLQAIKNIALGFALRVGARCSDHTKKKVRARRPEQRLTGPVPGMSFRIDDRALILLPSHRCCDFQISAPSNVVLCGPITRPFRPVGEDYPEFSLWLRQRPTVLINMGLRTSYQRREQIEFATAIVTLLNCRPELQVLWKLRLDDPDVEVDHEVRKLKSTVLPRNRLRVYDWFPVEPLAMLMSGNVVCVVHHGGANAYHEAIRAAIPQIVLPLQLDVFDYAQRVEYLGVGVWGSRKTTPRVTGAELVKAMLCVLTTAEGDAMRQRAEKVSLKLLRKNGRVVAHEKILETIGYRRMPRVAGF